MDRIKTYENLQESAWQAGNYWDDAYVDGYLVPLYIMLDDQQDDDGEHKLFDTAPFYFIYGADSPMRNSEEFRDAVKASSRRAPKQRAAARKVLEKIPEDMVLTHGPFLSGLSTENEYVEDEHAP